MDLETSIGFPDCLVDSVWAGIVYGYLEFDMNERVKQLAEQATIKRHWDSEQSLWIDRLVDTNKFAELLIKECIRIDVENPDSAPGVEIAKYFGVE